MPQAIPFIIAAAKAYGAKILTAIVLNVAAGAIVRALSSRDTPTPEQAKSQFRQAIPSAQIGFGRCRMSGPNLLFVTVGKFTLDVIAVANGPVDGYEAFYLNDDLIPVGTLGGGGVVPAGTDGRYGDGKVRILYRLGDMPETAFGEVVGIVNDDDVWGTSHRGDGVSTVALICEAVKPDNLSKVYPNYEPQISGVGRWMKAYDWRDEAQDREDPETWAWTDNAVVNYVHDEWFNRGQDWAYRFAPTLAFLTEAADVCDEAVPLKAGGTEPRYTAHGWYLLNNPPKDLRQRWLEAFDGYQIERGDGAFVIRAGKYEAPTVTLNEDRILECEWRRSRRSEDNANRLVLSYCSPDHAYTMVEADPWLDEADIAARGAEQSAPFERQWVTSNGQIRRLAKRQMTRIAAVYAGYLVIDLSEDESELEQRYFRVRNMRGPPSMHDVIVEVTGATLDLAKRRVRLDVVKADPLIDEWDPATEEGNAPGVAPSPPVTGVPVPVVLAVTSFIDGDSGAPRLQVVVTDIGRPDLQYVVSWRPDGDESWTDELPRPAIPLGTSPETLMFTSGLVPTVEGLEVRVQAVSSGGFSEYTDPPVNVDTVQPFAWTQPDFTATTDGTTVSVGWRYPQVPFGFVRLFYNTAPTFVGATAWPDDFAGALGFVESVDLSGIAPDGLWWWAVAYSTDGQPSTETGGDFAPVWVEPTTNLLASPSDFTNAAWQKNAGTTGTAPTVTGNTASAPDGTTTADRIQFSVAGNSGGNDQSYVVQFPGGAAAAQTGAVWLRSNTGADQTVYIRAGNTFLVVTVKPYWRRFPVVAPSAARGFFIGLRGSVTGALTAADVQAWQGHLAV